MAANRAVLIESFHKPGITVTFLSFFVLLVASMILGVGAPASTLPPQNEVVSLPCTSHNCSMTWSGHLTDITVLHQRLLLQAAIQPVHTDADESLRYKQEIVVFAEGIDETQSIHTVLVDHVRHERDVICEAGKPFCSAMEVFSQDFIHYHTYAISVQFLQPFKPFGQGVQAALKVQIEMSYVNPSFTVFDMTVQYVFLCITLVVAVLYMASLLRVKKRDWGYEQKWIFGLLLALVLFNRPLAALEVYRPNLMWTAASTVGSFTFITFLLLFWLCIMDVVRMSAHEDMPTSNRSVCFYLPKICIVSIFWVLGVITYLFMRLENRIDPSYEAHEDFDKWWIAQIAGLFVALVYGVYLLTLFILAFKELRGLPRQFQVVFALTFICCVTILVAAAMGGLHPAPGSVVAFMLAVGAVNAYIWTIAIAYLPWDSPEDDEDDIELAGLTLAGDDNLLDVAAGGGATFAINGSDDDDDDEEEDDHM